MRLLLHSLPAVVPPAAQSPMCDAPTFVSQLEDVYRGLWHRWLDGQH